METKSPAFDRLHALARRGYKAKIGADAADGTIVLQHLGKAPDLVLHPDGSIAEADIRRPRHKRRIEGPGQIAAGRDADELRFMSFLTTVSPPTLRDRTRPWRKKYVYVPSFMIGFWGVCLAVTGIIANL